MAVKKANGSWHASRLKCESAMREHVKSTLERKFKDMTWL